MADFRKWFLAFAVLALIAIPASAQIITIGGALQCVANGGVPPILRAEGLTEQVGDVVLNCTGGVPTAPGGNIPQVNVQVFLSTPITSRLTSTTGSQWSSALLMIDEPVPATNNGVTTPTASTAYGNNKAPRALFCPNSSGCAALTGGMGNVINPTATGNYAGPYSGFAGPGQGAAVANVFQGQQVATNSVAFLGVPFEAPGSMGGTRVIRITNIRTAPGAPSSSLIPQPVVEYISITGATSVPVNNPQQIVGYSQFGLDQNATFVSGAQNFSICNGQNLTPNNTLVGSGSQMYLTASEGFASAFKVRNIAQLADPLTATNAPQDIPSAVYNTETGFYYNGDPLTNAANNVTTAGLASNGTRLMFTLTNTAGGATVYVPNYVPLYSRGNPGGTPTGFAVLLSNADANGATGGFSSGGALTGNLTVASSTVSATSAQLGNAFSSGNTSFNPVAPPLPGQPLTPGIPTGVTPGLVAVPSSGALVYEVVQSSPYTLEQLSVPLVISFAGFAPGPVTGQQGTANVSFAPISPTETPATAQASTTLPIPRFVRTGSNQNTFIFNPCFCNILFPYVTTQQGYETGIAISNTSMDPFGTATSTGTVTINYYGMNAPTPAAGTTGFTTTGGPNAPCPGAGCVPAGGQLVFTVGGGGGAIISPTAGVSPVAQTLPTAANFQGYIIAQSRFKYCHGFAFITCAGCGATSPGASESYLGLILDGASANRTGSFSESLNQ